MAADTQRGPPTRLQDCGWLLAAPGLGLHREAGVLLTLCRELGLDSRLLERLAFTRHRNVDSTMNDGRTRLHYAATKADATRIAQLVTAGADVDAKDDWGSTPLCVAVAMGRPAATHALLAAGASPGLFQTTFSYGVAASEDDKAARHRLVLELVETRRVPELHLLDAGLFWELPDVVACSIDSGIAGLNAILADANQREYDVYELVNDCSASCASLFFPRLSRDYISLMMERCGDIGPKVRDLLRELVGFPAALGDLEGMNGEYGVNERSIALFAACGTGDLDLVKALLPMDGVHLGTHEIECSPWISSCWTTTHAAECGHAEIVRFIVDNPPHIYEKVDYDMSLLACGIIGDLARVHVLLRQGAEPWAAHTALTNASYEISSCLRAACTLGNCEMVRLLLEAGAPLSTMLAGGPTYFMAGGPWPPPCFNPNELSCVVNVNRQCWSTLDIPPTGPEDDTRRIDIIRMLVAAGADAAAVGLELNPLYLRAFPA
jgi:hypothetical protein